MKMRTTRSNVFSRWLAELRKENIPAPQKNSIEFIRTTWYREEIPTTKQVTEGREKYKDLIVAALDPDRRDALSEFESEFSGFVELAQKYEPITEEHLIEWIGDKFDDHIETYQKMPKSAKTQCLRHFERWMDFEDELTSRHHDAFDEYKGWCSTLEDREKLIREQLPGRANSKERKDRLKQLKDSRSDPGAKLPRKIQSARDNALKIFTAYMFDRLSGTSESVETTSETPTMLEEIIGTDLIIPEFIDEMIQAHEPTMSKTVRDPSPSVYIKINKYIDKTRNVAHPYAQQVVGSTGTQQQQKKD